MDNITMETRREAYEAEQPVMPTHRSRVLMVLREGPMTASEITEVLLENQLIPYFNRGFVAPRLTELRKMGLVEPCGRRKATRSDRTEAVWRRTAQ